MRFVTMESAGSGFIVMDNRTLRLAPEQLSRQAKELCQGKTSPGADGLIVVEDPEAGVDLAIRMFNPDGSVLAMCTNGIRCAAGYAFEHLPPGTDLRIRTCDKLVKVSKTGPQRWQLQLDPPELVNLENVWNTEDDAMAYAYLEFGGMPHVVIKYQGLTVQDVQNEKLLNIAKSIRYSKRYPQGVNVSFYDSQAEGDAVVITYERGPEAFTSSCGIGACASALVMMLQEQTAARQMNIRVPGGEYWIEAEVDQEHGAVKRLYLSGDTRRVEEGNTPGK